MKDSTPAFDDLSQVTQTVDFAYDEIDRRVFGVRDEVDNGMSAILEMQRRIWNWIYQEGSSSLDGFEIRCMVACWVFLPQLRGETMTAVAGSFGKHKQSLGRWVDDFKKEFPEVAKHLQHIKTE